MPQFLRTDSDNADFRGLVTLLDHYLAVMDGEEHAFYAQYNKSDAIKEVVVAYQNGKPAGCGAIKKYSDTETEIKRMYVLPEFRGLGIAKGILGALEKWASELGFSECILETGVKQVEAVQLYQKCGYRITENYGQYANMANSICMKKQL
ncbi:MAG TPA: GNAT family N-acetyltransferase [Flavobacterium sp.]|nr:GNAT family N-acetyltransferase [Flavobacterium sp.]